MVNDQSGRKLVIADIGLSLSPAFAGLRYLVGISLGLTPQALCCRLLRRLVAFISADVRVTTLALAATVGRRQMNESEFSSAAQISLGSTEQ